MLTRETADRLIREFENMSKVDRDDLLARAGVQYLVNYTASRSILADGMFYFLYQYFSQDQEYYPVIQWVPPGIQWYDYLGGDGRLYNGEWHKPLYSLPDGMLQGMLSAFWEEEVCPCGCRVDFAQVNDLGLRHRISSEQTKPDARNRYR